MRARLFAGIALIAGLAALPVPAEEGLLVTYPVDGSFEDGAFGVESAITDRGLVIDAVSHVGAMLNRTGSDVGSTVPLFAEADIYLFCSAVLSRRVMEADPNNIAHCPYGIILREMPDGRVEVGYRRMPDGAMQEVEALLDDIAREAAGLD
ncbi:MAG: DUF302 domain-containing protein [Pseudomonadota bacterium]